SVLPVSTNPVNDNSENQQQETLQALLALAASINPTNYQTDQDIYVSLLEEDRKKEESREPELEKETLEQLLEDEIRREIQNNTPQAETAKPPTTVPKNMPLLSFLPKNKNNSYPLIDLTLTCVENSSLPSYTSPNCLSTLLGNYSTTDPALLISIQMNEYQYKEVPVLLPNSIPSTLSICYDLGFNNEEQVEWFSYLDFGTLKLEVDEVASDADDIIDEVNRQFKIKRDLKY
ncbi:16110_t:CDS:2, partial [Gigaspora rosea]